MKNYLDLMQHVLDHGVEKEDRTGPIVILSSKGCLSLTERKRRAGEWHTWRREESL